MTSERGRGARNAKKCPCRAERRQEEKVFWSEHPQPRDLRGLWQTQCFMERPMNAPLDLFADDVIKTAYTRLLPLALLTGIAAVFCRAALEQLIAIIVTAFRRRSSTNRSIDSRLTVSSTPLLPLFDEAEAREKGAQ
jgi:hypothetical protein